ncbi:PtsGHI operon antiterminator [Bacillus sp. LL01]|uniref:PRD domain-containing protein n=1 Tax=Bacillus sp. LL01 TaxID=1665556 RepID=UPI00064D67DD|nr:PRD domain-containing protein [Bacillus sp. LL01]KMJ55657.1 PtsGHI operon antiterminator [Bacillus sp. LL01]
MKGPFRIEKVVNNNVVIATKPDLNEVIVIGRGIGFGQKRGQEIHSGSIDKLFVLANQEEQEQYKLLLNDVDESLIVTMEKVVKMIQAELKEPLHQRIHLAMTDHIQFAIRRIEQGIDIPNPFLTETELMFPEEFHLARKAVHLLNEHLDVELPEAEIGFVALHIYSASSNQPIAEMNEHPQLISDLVFMIERNAHIELNRRSVEYMRLVSFLCELIDRFRKKEMIQTSDKLAHLLKEEFELCYTITIELIEVLNTRFSTSYKVEQVPDMVFYLKKLIKYK